MNALTGARKEGALVKPNRNWLAPLPLPHPLPPHLINGRPCQAVRLSETERGMHDSVPDTEERNA